MSCNYQSLQFRRYTLQRLTMRKLRAFLCLMEVYPHRLVWQKMQYNFLIVLLKYVKGQILTQWSILLTR